MPDWRGIFDDLSKNGIAVDRDGQPSPVGGGDISAAWRIPTESGLVFLKTGGPDAVDMFAAEADGLAEIAASNTLRVPKVLGAGSAAGAWLALEWLELGRGSADTERRLGEGLAAMHRVVRDVHGWTRDNTIGATPQSNTPCKDWCEFYRDKRLRPQLSLAAERGYGGHLQQAGARLLERLDEIMGDHAPVPSLLHGDLWGGNHAAYAGEPVLFDPAVYFGDRETDLAMTRLFGGFSRAFYAAYEKAWPLPPGHETRLGLYQLYHVLNHLNLFGSSYLGSAERLINDVLRANG